MGWQGHRVVCGPTEEDLGEERISDVNRDVESLERIGPHGEIDVVIEELPPLPHHVCDAHPVGHGGRLITCGVADGAGAGPGGTRGD